MCPVGQLAGVQSCRPRQGLTQMSAWNPQGGLTRGFLGLNMSPAGRTVRLKIRAVLGKPGAPY